MKQNNIALCSREVPVLPRFWPKVVKTTKCWNWTGDKIPRGYGMIQYRLKRMLVHRFSWELHNGAIPDGLCVLHRCDNRACVNPSHLFLGTKNDNSKDMVHKNRQFHPVGELNGRAKLNLQTVKLIKRLASNTSQSVLARRFDVSRQTINGIVKERRWLFAHTSRQATR